MKIHAPLAAETIAHLGPIPITNSMLTSVLVMALLLVLAWLATRKMQLVPGRYQALWEMVVEFLLDLSEDTAGKRVGRKVFPLIATFFIFILTANWMGLLPGIGPSIYVKVAESAGHGAEEIVHVPLFRAANADLNMTVAMALLSITVVQISGILVNGIKGYLKHLATPPLLAPVHIVSELSHIISLAARLFGNIFGGEVLVTVMYALVPVVVPAVFLGLEVLFGFIQALIFTVLSIVYIALATAGDHEEHGEQAHAAPAH
ncbi:MAG: F0F1 ATP synthase subunit A [Chloroflexi bacterium]|nr:F0F1 ATP synthase subunit A [Chloroflexota bacterium]